MKYLICKDGLANSAEKVEDVAFPKPYDGATLNQEYFPDVRTFKTFEAYQEALGDDFTKKGILHEVLRFEKGIRRYIPFWVWSIELDEHGLVRLLSKFHLVKMLTTVIMDKGDINSEVRVPVIILEDL